MSSLASYTHIYIIIYQYIYLKMRISKKTNVYNNTSYTGKTTTLQSEQTSLRESTLGC